MTRANDIGRLFIFLLLLVLTGFILATYAEGPVAVLLVFLSLLYLAFIVPEIIFYGLLIATPFSVRYILPFQAEMQLPSEPFVAILVIVCVARWYARRLNPELANGRRFPFAYPILFLTAATFVSLINSPDIYVSGKGAIRATGYMFLCFVVYDLVREKRHLTAVAALSVPSAIIAVVWTSIVLLKNIHLWQWRAAYRGTPFTNYSVYGSFLAAFLVIFLCRFLFDRSKYDRVTWTLAFAIFASGMLLCFSRGVWLSILMVIGALMFAKSDVILSRKLVFLCGLLAVILVVANIPGVSSVLMERLHTLTDARFASNRARLLRWGAALMLFLKHPIIGNGYGGFTLLYQGDPFVSGFLAKYKIGAHSEHIQILAEMGIVGFAAWTWVIAEFYRYGIGKLRRIGDNRYSWLIIGIMSAQTTFLIHFFVNNLLAADKVGVLFWGLYGLLPAVGEMAEKSTEKCSEKLTAMRLQTTPLTENGGIEVANPAHIQRNWRCHYVE